MLCKWHRSLTQYIYREFHPSLVHQSASPQSQAAAVASLAPVSVPFLALVVVVVLPPPQVAAGVGHHPLPLGSAKEQEVQEQEMELQQELGRLPEQEGWQGSGQELGHPWALHAAAIHGYFPQAVKTEFK